MKHLYVTSSREPSEVFCSAIHPFMFIAVPWISYGPQIDVRENPYRRWWSNPHPSPLHHRRPGLLL